MLPRKILAIASILHYKINAADKDNTNKRKPKLIYIIYAQRTW